MSFDVFQSISARKFQYLSTSFHCFQSMFVYDLSTSFSLFQFFQCLLLLIISMSFIVFQQFQRFSCQCLLANVIIFRQFQHKIFQCISTLSKLSVYFYVFQRLGQRRSGTFPWPISAATAWTASLGPPLMERAGVSTRVEDKTSRDILHISTASRRCLRFHEAATPATPPCGRGTKINVST